MSRKEKGEETRAWGNAGCAALPVLPFSPVLGKAAVTGPATADVLAVQGAGLCITPLAFCKTPQRVVYFKKCSGTAET